MSLLKTFLPDSIHAIAPNPNIDLQSINYSETDRQHHIRTTISRTPYYNGYNSKTAKQQASQIFINKAIADFLEILNTKYI